MKPLELPHQPLRRARVLTPLLVLLAWLPASVPASSSDDRPLDWLKELVGEWEGESHIEGSEPRVLPARARFHLTGDGTAVIESLDLGGHKMTSVYHEDGDTLRMTHFCAANNQPRLRLAAIDRENRSVELTLVDVTNLASEGSFHVVGYEIHPRAEQLTLIITARMGETERRERVELVRVEGGGSGPAKASW